MLIDGKSFGHVALVSSVEWLDTERINVFIVVFVIFVVETMLVFYVISWGRSLSARCHKRVLAPVLV